MFPNHAAQAVTLDVTLQMYELIKPIQGLCEKILYFCTPFELSMEIQEYDFGEAIKKVLKEQERSEAWLARKVHCDPGNFNRILKKRSIDIDLLRRISMVLGYNFIREYAQVVEQQLLNGPAIS